MDNSRLIALDGLRGVAAIMVVFCHARNIFFPFYHGFLAVDLFFMLSGFVIAKSYEPGLASGRMTVSQYVKVRLERLYPLLFLGSVIGVLVLPWGLGDVVIPSQADWLRALISQFLLIPFLLMPHFFAFNSAHWSILFELLANFTHATFLHWLTPRVLVAIIAVSGLGTIWGAQHFGTFNLGWTVTSAGFGFFRVGFGFFIGVYLYRTREIWMPRMPRVYIGVLFAALLAAGNMPKEFISDGWPFLAADFVTILLVFPALVMLGAVAKGGQWSVWLGTLSFPLYAIHKPLVEVLTMLHWGDGLACLAIIWLILVSWVIGRWVDEPLNDWRRARRKAAKIGKAAVA
jgi:peptidoglycan/LPS O-acetylase OafA/YrhL